MRINKYIALCGVASRRKSEEYVKNGKVKVNGQIISSLATNIDVKTDKVELEGKVLSLPSNYVYYKLNKPKGYLCSRDDGTGRKTIYDLVKSDIRLFSIGRLDYETEGLIILTNDGDVAQKISHPGKEIEKEYIMKIDGKILESELAVLRNGVVENGVRLPKAKVNVVEENINQTKLSVIIHEGKNRQIRRMFECIGKNIILLKRVRIGEINLGGLARGKHKELNDYELSWLLSNLEEI